MMAVRLSYGLLQIWFNVAIRSRYELTYFSTFRSKLKMHFLVNCQQYVISAMIIDFAR